jgi:hypothetical protein
MSLFEEVPLLRSSKNDRRFCGHGVVSSSKEKFQNFCKKREHNRLVLEKDPSGAFSYANTQTNALMSLNIVGRAERAKLVTGCSITNREHVPF